MGEEDLSTLEKYIKEGLDEGFNLTYIKKVLEEGGHTKDSVETAANNVKGLKAPDGVQEHLKEVTGPKKPARVNRLLSLIVIILLIASIFFGMNYFVGKAEAEEAKTQLEEIEELGVDLDNLEKSINERMKELKDEDIPLDEKEELIEDQIEELEKANKKLEKQRKKINELLFDLLNRMIARLGGG